MRAERRVFANIWLICVMLSVSVSQVRPRQAQEASVAGYELYSWSGTGGGWNFCIRPNTSSEATVEEVFNEKTVLRGVEQLKRRIARLPAGAEIYWFDRIPLGKGPKAKGSERIGYPPAEVREQIRGYAEKHRIKVLILSSLFKPLSAAPSVP
jgi:hypothetical protein